MQYSKITPEALKAGAATDPNVAWTPAGMQALPTDHKPEYRLTLRQYLGAAEIAVERTGFYWGPARAHNLHEHHKNVVRIEARYGILVAMHYDVGQRMKLAHDSAHDIAATDQTELSELNNLYGHHTVAGQAADAAADVRHSGAGKRAAPAAHAGPSKQARTGFAGGASSSAAAHCFRCGVTGCMPSVCTASTTTGGKPCADRDTKAKSPNAIMGPNAQGAVQGYCFQFGTSKSCRAGCPRMHQCSICHATGHGAGACPHAK